MLNYKGQLLTYNSVLKGRQRKSNEWLNLTVNDNELSQLRLDVFLFSNGHNSNNRCCSRTLLDSCRNDDRR